MTVQSACMQTSPDDERTRAFQGNYLTKASSQRIDNSLFWSTTAQVNFDMHLVKGDEAKEARNKDEATGTKDTVPSLHDQPSQFLPKAASQTHLPQCCPVPSFKQHAMEKAPQKQPPDLLARLEAAEKNLGEAEFRVSQFMLVHAMHGVTS